MKSALIAVAATALLGNAAANVHDRHQGFHNRRNALELRNDDGEVCGCTTYVTTITGPATLAPTPQYSAPAGTPSAPAGTPSAPAGAPSAPAGSSAPAGVPSAPAGSPSAPAGSPSAPAGTPSAPASAPSAPAGSPSSPAGVPSAPAGSPSAPAGSPSAPAGSPSAPAGSPSSPAGEVPATSSGVDGVPVTTPAAPPSSAAPAPSVPATPEAPAPTPVVSTYATPGTYTIPATTLTVTDTTTVCGATTTSLTPGVNTYGGVTTSVVTATTVTCPYATVETAESTTTSVIKTTTYTCPAGGEYTIVPPYTTSVPEATVTHYPTPATYTPGTYTAPEQTVTITKTNDVYVCPAATPLGGAPSGSSPASATPVPTSGVDGAVGSPSSTPATSTSAASTPAGAASTPASSSSPSTGPEGFTHNGNQWAMTYTPYSADGNCREASGVLEDLKDIKSKGFTTVRLYATDCDGLKTVGDAAEETGLRMIIGVYVKETGLSGSDVSEQVTDIISWGKTGKWDLVDLVVIGNESVFNGFCTASELASFITSFKSKITSAGLSLTKFTTTETLNILQGTEFSALCDVIDVIGVNVQPYFNSQCTAEKAGDFVVSQLELAKKACPNVQDVLNLESGWPHQGGANGAASASGDEQATAIKSIIEKAGTNSVIFSYGDDSWKSSGEFGVEQYFGCASQFELISGTLKIGGLSLSLDIGSDGIDLDLDLNL